MILTPSLLGSGTHCQASAAFSSMNGGFFKPFRVHPIVCAALTHRHPPAVTCAPPPLVIHFLYPAGTQHCMLYHWILNMGVFLGPFQAWTPQHALCPFPTRMPSNLTPDPRPTECLAHCVPTLDTLFWITPPPVIYLGWCCALGHCYLHGYSPHLARAPTPCTGPPFLLMGAILTELGL